MKKTLLILLCTITVSIKATACDICGCGAGNSYIGILPDFYKHIFGLRYRYNSLHTHLGVNGANTYLTTHEKYSIAELWGGWTFKNRWRAILTVPYSLNEKTNQAGSSNKSGISDITLSGYYQLLNKKGTVGKDKLFVQSLWIGGGIKLATGQYNPADKSSGNQNANLFQLGTGSTDFIAAAMYDARIMDAGINISAQYKFNGTNQYSYTYGDKVSLSSQLYYKIKAGQVSFAPNAGVQYERSRKDRDNGFDVDLSGGKVLMGSIGIETNYNKIAIGANWQTPLSQDLASGFIKANNRMMVHLAFAF